MHNDRPTTPFLCLSVYILNGQRGPWAAGRMCNKKLRPFLLYVPNHLSAERFSNFRVRMKTTSSKDFLFRNPSMHVFKIQVKRLSIIWIRRCKKCRCSTFGTPTSMSLQLLLQRRSIEITGMDLRTRAFRRISTWWQSLMKLASMLFKNVTLVWNKLLQYFDHY